MGLLIFLAVVGTAVALLHAWFWRRLVRDAAWSQALRRTATRALIVLGATIPAAIALHRVLPQSVATTLAWAGFTWLGVMFYLALVLAALEPVRPLVRNSEFDDPALVTRRELFARAAGIGSFAVASGVSATAALGATGPIAVRRVEIGVAGLDPRLAGFRFVQITDMHIGPILRGDFVREVVGIANGLDADVIVLTGDLVDGSVAELRDIVAPLADLRAREGAFLVTGNHEHYVGADEWVRHLGTLGVRALRNAHVVVGAARGGITLAGVDDYAAANDAAGGGPDLSRALEGADRSRATVLLAHQPKAVHDAAREGVSVQLSGHTHGGQMWPFGLFVRLVQPAVRGLHFFGATALYVSSGTGFWGPPMRLGTEAEVTVVELYPGA